MYICRQALSQMRPLQTSQTSQVCLYIPVCHSEIYRPYQHQPLNFWESGHKIQEEQHDEEKKDGWNNIATP